jgi:hypothetical protein
MEKAQWNFLQWSHGEFVGVAGLLNPFDEFEIIIYRQLRRKELPVAVN